MVLDVGKILGSYGYPNPQKVDAQNTSSGAYVSHVNENIGNVIDKKYPTFSPESRDGVRGQKLYCLG